MPIKIALHMGAAVRLWASAFAGIRGHSTLSLALGRFVAASGIGLAFADVAWTNLSALAKPILHGYSRSTKMIAAEGL